MSDRQVIKLKASEVYPLQDAAQVCEWCRRNITKYRQYRRTPIGHFVCEDCAGMAEEVGQGPIVIDSFDYHGITYTITPPLSLELEIRYDRVGHWWMEALAGDHPLAGDLFSESENNTGSIDGTDRDDIREKAEGNIIDSWDWLHEDLEQADPVSQDAQGYRDRIAMLAAIITPRPSWPMGMRLKEEEVV